MLPVLFEVGGVEITSFGVFMALGFLVAAMVAAAEMRRRGMDPELAWDLVLYAAVAGILGAKVYYLLLTWPETVADPWRALTARAGLVWYGGFMGSMSAGLFLLWRRRIPMAPVLDVGALAIAVGYGIGRVGCFLVGDDYGRPSDLPWAVAFPEGAPPSTARNLRHLFGVDIPASIPDSAVLAVHPTQLYEAGMSFLIFAVLWRLRHRFQSPGTLFGVWLALAGVERFVVELFRAKDDRFFAGLTLAQTISVALLLTGVAVALRARRGAWHASGVEPHRALP